MIHFLMHTLHLNSDESKALLYDEDNDKYTPVLTAAAHEHDDAFQCLLKKADLQRQIFKAFDIENKEDQLKILKVRYTCKVLMGYIFSIHLHYTFQKKNTFQFMINHKVRGKELSSATTEDSRTLLHFAAERGIEM